jgi:ComF family protein
MNFTLYNQLRQAINWLLPKNCVQCKITLGNHQGSVCANCYPELPFQYHYCHKCGQNYSANTDYCGHCLSAQPSFDHCFCPFRYESSIKDLICKLKYRQQPELAKAAASLLMGELIESDFKRPDALIAVPMHISRLRERGYNHSTLIAQHLSKTLDIPLLRHALIKSRATIPQAQQSLKQRKQNLADSFRLKTNIDVKNVAIVDDVVTTGSTAEEIAKILKKNGVDYVQVWGIAHTR